MLRYVMISCQCFKLWLVLCEGFNYIELLAIVQVTPVNCIDELFYCIEFWNRKPNSFISKENSPVNCIMLNHINRIFT